SIAGHLRAADPSSRAAADRLVLTASTSEAYGFLFKLLCDPGDRILVPAPSYPLFEYLAALEGVTVTTYPLVLEDRFRYDVDAVAAALHPAAGPAPRALVLVNPNNPTGTGLTASDRAALDRLAAAAGVAIISDEVFLDYPWADPIASAAAPDGDAGPAALTFTMGGLSKGSALPQMKLGWILVSGPDGATSEALDRLDLIADSYLSVGTPVQAAAPRLLEMGSGLAGAVRERLRVNLAHIQAALSPVSACRLLPADGGWSAVLQVPAVRPEEELVVTLLRDENVLVHPGYFFDFPTEAFLVISLLPDPARFMQGLGRLLRVVDGT
ncbi:MAG TPA: pyridoxal phosphate-dependent aminotransferase, partial [Candidatus Polarisedimenticolia bacterium]|nr:pyridoxal phosphate-dependent aminotransferase [Candidatus Polarisedimenticolia bacterium]